MPLYRVIYPVAVGERIIKPGTLSRLPEIRPTALEALVKKGTISIATLPPLAVLPGWRLRAKRVAEALGIVDAGVFLDRNPEEVSAAVGVSVVTVKKWQADVEHWLTLDAPARRR